MTGCSCREHCRFPDVGDPDVRELHRVAHVNFALYVAEHEDRHGFREPTPRDIVRYVGQDFDVPTRCVRAEHAGTPNHPVPH